MRFVFKNSDNEYWSGGKCVSVSNIDEARVYVYSSLEEAKKYSSNDFHPVQIKIKETGYVIRYEYIGVTYFMRLKKDDYHCVVRDMGEATIWTNKKDAEKIMHALMAYYENIFRTPREFTVVEV